MRKALKITAVLFAFLLAGVVGVGQASAEEPQPLIDQCGEVDGVYYYVPCDQVPHGGGADSQANGPAISSQSVNSGAAQSQPTLQQNEASGPKAKQPASAGKSTPEPTATPGTALVADAESSNPPGAAAAAWILAVLFTVASVYGSYRLIRMQSRRTPKS